MKLTTTEFTQRAENGGSPLDNESAHMLGIGHGTPLIVMPKRQFVALLKRAQLAGLAKSDMDFVTEVEELLKEHDSFVQTVSSQELYEDSDEHE